MGEIASPSQLRLSFLRWALVTVPLIVLLGIASGRLSNANYGNPWFDALAKPTFMPPGWAFGVAWTVLYVLLGFAVAVILHARGARGRAIALTLFIVQLLLNFAWSPTFFVAHRVTTALWLIVAIFVLAAVTAALFWRIRRLAGVLMLPYLAWLLFAATLNQQIVALNPEAEMLAPAAGNTQITL